MYDKYKKPNKTDKLFSVEKLIISLHSMKNNEPNY